MNRQALWVALLCSAFSVVLLFAYLRRFEQEVSGGERVEVLFAVKPIERGEVIKDEMLATRSIPPRDNSLSSRAPRNKRARVE